jgi:hypothetical protein
MRITGTRPDADTREVWVDGTLLSPARSQQLWNHSPDGFEWGYAGSGPAQLALAIVLEAGLDDATAVRLHQRFKAAFVQGWPRTFDVDIDWPAWLADQARRDGY